LQVSKSLNHSSTNYVVHAVHYIGVAGEPQACVILSSMNLRQAVQRLRAHTGKSQQYLATELRMSTHGLQRYEAGRPQTPDPRLLFSFLACAVDHGRLDLADTFKRELVSLMDPPPNFHVEITVTQRKGKQA
jgi:hypothetical protein